MTEIWDEDFRFIHDNMLGMRPLDDAVYRLAERADIASVPRQLYGSRLLDLLCMLTDEFPNRLDFRRCREDAAFIQTTTDGTTQWPDDFVEQLLARVRTAAPHHRHTAFVDLLLAGQAIQPSEVQEYAILIADAEAVRKLGDVRLTDAAAALAKRAEEIPICWWRRGKRITYLFRMFADAFYGRADVRQLAEDVEFLERSTRKDALWPPHFVRVLGKSMATLPAYMKAGRLVDLLNKGRTIHPWKASEYDQLKGDLPIVRKLANLPLLEIVVAIQSHADKCLMPGRSIESRLSDLADLFELACPRRPDFCLMRRFTILRGFTIPTELLSPEEIEQSLRAALDHVRILKGPHSSDIIRVLSWLDTNKINLLDTVGPTNLTDLDDVLQDATGNNAVISLDQTRLEDAVLAGVFLPVVQKQVDRMLARKSQALLPAAELVAMVDRAMACLPRVLAWDNPSKNPFPIDAATGALRFRQSAPKGLPWGDLDVTIRLITAIKTACNQFLGSGIDLTTAKDDDIRRALSSLQMLLQASWLTSREVRALIDQGLKSSWLRYEAELLALLHLVERGVGNCFRAGEYAVCSVTLWNAADEKPGGLMPSSFVLQAVAYAAELGVRVPDTERVEREPGQGPPDHEMLTRMPPDEHLLTALNGLTAAGWQIRGFGVRAIDSALYGVKVADKVLADLFRIAFRRGFLARASRLTFGREAAISAQLTPDDIVTYADAVANAGQKLVHVLDASKHNSFRRSLRKLWRHMPADMLTTQQHLFVHHVVFGVSFNAIAGHRHQELALAYLSKASGEGHFRSVSEHAATIRFGHVLGALTWSRMKDSWLRVPPKTAFVSITIRDGHTVNVLAFGSSIAGRSGPSKQLEVVSTLGEQLGPDETDWTSALENYAAAMQRKIQTCVQLGIPVGRLGSWRIDELWRYIVDAALQVQPDVQTILLHAAPYWDVIPWQHMLQCMEQRPQHLELAVRVPGVIVSGLPNSKKKPTRVYDTSAMDEACPPAAPEQPVAGQIVSDKDSAHLSARLVEGTPERAPRTLTVVRHAVRGAIGARFSGETDASTRVIINDVCGSSDHVVLHTCHAASGSSFRTTSDVDSLPVMFLAHGAQSVVAPGLPVSHEAVFQMDQHFFGHPQSGNRFDVYGAYRAAVHANSETALYTLYDRTRAPALVVTQYQHQPEWRRIDALSRMATPTRTTNLYRRFPAGGLGNRLRDSSEPN